MCIAIEPLFYSIQKRANVWARVLVNDFPLYTKTTQKADSVSCAFNEYLVPGENRITFQVLRSEDVSALPPMHRWTVAARVYHKAPGLEDTPPTANIQTVRVLELSYPDVQAEVEERFQRLPFHFAQTFQTPLISTMPTPVWCAAPEVDFGPDGTPELRAAVMRLATALELGSADAFVAELGLKMAHYEGAYGGAPGAAASRHAQTVEQFFACEPMVRPIVLSELHFAPLHGGRVCHVSRLDGEPVLDVKTKRERRHLRADLLFTQDAGHWRVFA